MTLHLPNSIGEPAPEGINPRDRFVIPAIAIKKELQHIEDHDEEFEPRVMALARSGQLPEPRAAYEELWKGRMPRLAGLMKLSNGVVGAIDLMAYQTHQQEAEILPQPKGAVDEETKIICARGIITLSQFNPMTGDLSTIKVFGEAINPDEEPWRAQELGIDGRCKQNEHGLVIAQYDPLNKPIITSAPRVDLDRGSAIIPRM